MNNDYKIKAINNRDQIPWGVIGGGINDYNMQHAGDDHSQRICFVVQGPDDRIVGGVIGIIYWDWFSLDLMFLEEEFRGQGYGHQLLVYAEEEAKKRGAKYVHLDTFSFQAPEFYKKHGYQVFGELNDFPQGYQRYYLRKQL